ncbi:hypothetical protein PR048_032649 [Dryococelus australis]|uniref:Tc1-like transposase DDE domain-containing protein n=1 Tax=Dryococelus australis TaxID=614101 RepID=A0ABQ9G5Y5_9NEOP|nr:hypothetical protein PR048_032649 [Dryococelus australis]
MDEDGEGKVMRAVNTLPCFLSPLRLTLQAITRPQQLSCRGKKGLSENVSPRRTGLDSRPGRPWFSHVEIVADDASGFLGDIPFPPPFHSGAASSSPRSPPPLNVSQDLTGRSNRLPASQHPRGLPCLRQQRYANASVNDESTINESSGLLILITQFHRSELKVRELPRLRVHWHHVRISCRAMWFLRLPKSIAQKMCRKISGQLWCRIVLLSVKTAIILDLKCREWRRSGSKEHQQHSSRSEIEDLSWIISSYSSEFKSTCDALLRQAVVFTETDRSIEGIALTIASPGTSRSDLVVGTPAGCSGDLSPTAPLAGSMAPFTLLATPHVCSFSTCLPIGSRYAERVEFPREESLRASIAAAEPTDCCINGTFYNPICSMVLRVREKEFGHRMSLHAGRPAGWLAHLTRAAARPKPGRQKRLLMRHIQHLSVNARLYPHVGRVFNWPLRATHEIRYLPKSNWVPMKIVDLCFTVFGEGPLVFVRGSMNTEAYCNILDNGMLQTLWRFYEMDPCYFQDDNARCHVSRATMQWYTDCNVRRLDWPVRSPYLNPIEHLWDELYRRVVRARQARPKSIAQFVEWLQEEWRRIPVDVLQTLVESMPDRMAAVIAARCGPTRF